MQAGIHLTLRGSADWHALRDSIGIPEGLPLLGDLPDVVADAEIQLALTPDDSGVDARAVLAVDLAVPEEPRCFGVTFDRVLHVRADIDLSASVRGGTGLAFAGGTTLSTRLRLPVLSGLAITTGDPAGWIGVRVEVKAGMGGEASGLRFEVLLSSLAALHVNLPGFDRSRAPFSAALDEVGGAVAWSPDRPRSLAGELMARVTVGVHPRLDSEAPRAFALVDALLGAIDLDVETELRCKIDDRSVQLQAEFSGAAVEVDVFGLLRQLTGGGPTIDAGGSGLRVGAELAGFRVAIDATAGPSCAVDFGLRVGDAGIPLFIELSPKNVGFGVGARVRPRNAIEIPLFIRPPFDAEQFERLRAAEDALCAPVRARLLPGGQGRFDDMRTALWDTLALLIGAKTRSGAPDFLFKAIEDADGVWRLEGTDGKGPVRNKLPVQMALGFAADGRAVLMGRVGDEPFSPLAVDPRLVFSEFSIAVPLQSLQNISVSGTVGLAGFAGLLAALNEPKLTLGVSPDLVFFEIKAAPPTTIVVPDIGKYKGGQITIGGLRVGIGIPRRSFSVAFKGELILPEALIDDLDVSEFGMPAVRLPVRSSIGFRFDLTPIVIGDVVIPFPTLEFDVDLRRPNAALAPVDGRCEPVWDGLQVIVPDVLRVSFERMSYSPMILFWWSGNSNLQGDFSFGDEAFGLDVVLERGYWIWGLDSGLAVALAPILSVPFFDRLCLRLSFAGFHVHISLERPIPSFSPLALFEMLAWVADPLHYKVARRGELADMVRVTLRGAELALPPALAEVLPAPPEALTRNVEYTINLATFLNLAPSVVGLAEGIVDATAAALRRLPRAGEPPSLDAKALTARLPRPQAVAEAIVRLLPASMRQWRITSRLGGFSAVIELVLASAAELQEAQAVAMPRKRRGLITNEQVASGSGHPRGEVAGGPRPSLQDPASAPASATAWLWDTLGGLDVAALGIDASWGAYALAAANVEIWPGAGARFLGAIGSGGHVRMIAVGGLPRLSLPVVGIEQPLVVACAAGLMLQVTPRASGGFDGVVDGAMAADWQVPGLLSLKISGADGGSTASIRLGSDGKFAAQGSVDGDLFGGFARLTGALSVNQERADLTGGHFEWTPLPGLRVVLDGVEGHIGPGARIALCGKGRVTIFDMTASEVEVHVTERGVTFAADLKGPDVLPALPALGGRMSVDGGISWANGVVDARFACRGRLAVVGFGLDGDGELRVGTGGLELAMNGSLEWLNHRWLGAGVRITGGQVTVHGLCSFRIEPGVPDGLQELFGDQGLLVAGSLKAEATVDFAGNFGAVDLGGSLTLALRCGGHDFPLASLSAEKRLDGGFRKQLEVVLLEAPLRLPDLTIKLPKFPKIVDKDLTFEVGKDLTFPIYLNFDGTTLGKATSAKFAVKVPSLSLGEGTKRVSIPVLGSADLPFPTLSATQTTVLEIGKEVTAPFYFSMLHAGSRRFELGGRPDDEGRIWKVAVPGVHFEDTTVTLKAPDLGLDTAGLSLVLRLGGADGIALCWRKKAGLGGSAGEDIAAALAEIRDTLKRQLYIEALEGLDGLVGELSAAIGGGSIWDPNDAAKPALIDLARRLKEVRGLIAVGRSGDAVTAIGAVARDVDALSGRVAASTRTVDSHEHGLSPGGGPSGVAGSSTGSIGELTVTGAAVASTSSAASAAHGGAAASGLRPALVQRTAVTRAEPERSAAVAEGVGPRDVSDAPTSSLRDEASKLRAKLEALEAAGFTHEEALRLVVAEVARRDHG